MFNKVIICIFMLLLTLSNAFAFKNDPEVFKIFRDGQWLACAEIDNDNAYCWKTSDGFLKLTIDQDDKFELVSEGAYHIYDEYISPSEFGSYVATLEDLVVKMLNENDYHSKYSRTLMTKIRALGAAIYIYHSHDGMVTICDSLPTARGVRRLAESLWDGIGRWLG